MDLVWVQKLLIKKTQNSATAVMSTSYRCNGIGYLMQTMVANGV